MHCILNVNADRREIHGHEVEGAAVQVRVLAMDKPSDGGASHDYRIERDDGAQVCRVTFHRGELEFERNDVNGGTHEAMIAILLDRLKGFQDGPFACSENEKAAKHLKAALDVLKDRTKKRLERKVEGTLVA